MSETKLLPCPFCGGVARVRGERYYQPNVRRNVICTECFSNSGWYKTDEEAIKAWNTRKPMEHIVEILKEEAFDMSPENLDCKAVWLYKAIEIVKEGGSCD